MENVLIAGAAGFLGSHLVDYHLANGDRVIGIDNLSTGRISNLSLALQSDQFTFLEMDVCDVSNNISNCSIIYHLASPASPPKYLELASETIRANSKGTLALLDLANFNNARLVFASTSEIYGDPLVHPQTEDYWGNVNPIGPRSVYDESKRFGEMLLANNRRESGTNVCIVRIFNTFGPRMDPYDGRVVSTFIRQMLNNEPVTLHGDGSATRSFCYVNDLIQALFLAGQSEEFGPMNVGSSREITLNELIALLSRITNVNPTIEYLPNPEDDPKRRCPDIGLAYSLLGWLPTTELEDGIKETVKYFAQST